MKEKDLEEMGFEHKPHFYKKGLDNNDLWYRKGFILVHLRDDSFCDIYLPKMIKIKDGCEEIGYEDAQLVKTQDELYSKMSEMNIEWFKNK